MHEERDHKIIYKCYMCGQPLRSKTVRRIHYELHALKTHNCDYCEMSFLKIKELIEHNNPHPETYKPQTVCRILESHTYIERPEKIAAVSDGKHKTYERIQKTTPINKRQHVYFQRIGGAVVTETSIQDRRENRFVDKPVTFFQNQNQISEELATDDEMNEEDCDESDDSEIVVPDDEDFDKCSKSGSENNDSIQLDELSENVEQNKSLEELQFFSTEELNSNPRSSRSSSSGEELNGIFVESDGIKPMDDLEEDNSPNEEKTILNNSLSPSTSKQSDVLESNANKYTNYKRLKRKFLYKVRTKEIRIIKTPIPSYNQLVHQSNNGFKISSKRNIHKNCPWRLATENLKNI